MFGFLKDKLKKTIKNISEKIKKKPVEKPIDEPVEENVKEKEKVPQTPPKEKEKLPKQFVETKKQKKEERVKEIKEKEEVKESKPGESKGFIQKLKDLGKFRLNEDDFEEFFEQLEFTLIENNVAMEVIDTIKENLKGELVNQLIPKKDIDKKIKSSLRNSIENILIEPFDFVEKVKTKKPFVIAFFGINGSGKTTTIARITNLLQKNKLSCVLAASDTFRAASMEQLQKHADRLGVKMIKHQYNADPAAVAYDAIAHANSNNIDVVLIDTAGRMHTSSNLMNEMEKIVRVSKPDLKIFVGEAIIGNDAVEQAKAFNDAIGIDGIILCKADVDEKGGASISVGKVTGKPILFLGVGQKYDDLEKFNKDKIIKSLGL